MLPAKRKTQIISLCFFVVFLLAFVFGVLPLLKKLKNSSERLAFKKATLELLRTHVATVQDFQNSTSVYQQDLEKINSSFIDVSAPIEFIEFLEARAAAAGLQITVSPRAVAAAEGDPWLSTGFDIVLGGTSGDCLKFLEQTEQSHWLIEIIQFNVERFSEQSRAPQGLSSLKPGDVVTHLSLRAFSKR